jgi:DNA-directed RNA polymerase II subunit RPB2
MTEADGTVAPMFPNEARLRNLTYSAPLYIDMKKRVMVQDGDERDPETGELAWTEERGEQSGEEEEKIYIGKVPIMLKSHFCILDGLEESDVVSLNECPFDKVSRRVAVAVAGGGATRLTLSLSFPRRREDTSSSTDLRRC